MSSRAAGNLGGSFDWDCLNIEGAMLYFGGCVFFASADMAC
jgi:hypothetical protein